MLNDVVAKIILTIKSGYAPIRAAAGNLMYFLLIIDILFFAIYMMLGKNKNISAIVEKIIQIGFFVFLLNNFSNLSFAFMRSCVSLTAKFNFNFNPDFFTNPSAILKFASNRVIKPLEKLIDQSQPKGGILPQFPDFKLILIFGLAWLCCMVCFIILALQLCFASIEFHLMVLMGLILVPFVVLEQTRFIGIKVFPAIAGQAIKLAIISLVCGITVSIFDSYLTFRSIEVLSIDYIIVLISTTGLLGYLAIQIPSLASSLLSGIPNLSLSSFLQNVSSGVNASANTVRTVTDSVNKFSKFSKNTQGKIVMGLSNLGRKFRGGKA
jgi:type IV secretion system protein TrbL